MNFSRPVTPNPLNAAPTLRIKTPEKLIVLTYEQMKRKLIEDGNLDYDSIISDDKERSVCIYMKDGIKYVLKMGSHGARNDTTKFKLLRNEDKIYMAIQKLSAEKKMYFPNVYDSGSVDEKFYYIIMEYVNGITLYDYISSSYATGKTKNKHEALTILLNLTKALNTLFSIGIIHGDLSVENVMIEPSLNVKLIDFEKSSTDIKLEQNTIGTGLNINDRQSTGIGYFFLVVKTLSVVENNEKFKGLLTKIKTEIDSCTYCKNIYSNCQTLLENALRTGGIRRKTRRMKSRMTRKAQVK
jgi:serine/threonine protein kinase